ncbi:MAG: protein kinase, partial [Myxococcota bacterium]
MSDSAQPPRKRAGRPPPLEAGTVIDDRFRVVAVLGKGGMGSVYEAVNIKLRKRVAIKVLKPELAAHKTAVQRFLREARAASVIQHRNIVNIHDYGELDGGLVYYVMEHLQGQELAKLLADVGRLPWARARGILLQTVRALKAAHDVGIIHRDIKPANVFLVEPREDEPPDGVKVLDFGIAKTDGASPGTTVITGLGDLMGTAWYMAPELAQGVAADQRTDIYAVGILMYQVLTGRVPFDDMDSFRVLLRHANEEPRPIRELAPGVPPPVEQVVLRCLAKQPDLRHQTMRGLEHALSSVGPRGEPVEPSTRPPKISRPDDPMPPPLIRPPEQRAVVPVPPAALASEDGPEITAVLEGGGLPRDRIPQTQYIPFEAPPRSAEPEPTHPRTLALDTTDEAPEVPPTEYLGGLGAPPSDKREPTAVEPAPTGPAPKQRALQRQDSEEVPTRLLVPRKPPRKTDEDEAPTQLLSVDRRSGPAAAAPQPSSRLPANPLAPRREPRSSARRVSPPGQGPKAGTPRAGSIEVAEAVPAPPRITTKSGRHMPVPSAELVRQSPSPSGPWPTAAS